MNWKALPLVLLVDVFLPAFAEAKTLKFPKSNPQFSVTFASDWKAEITDAGIISAQPKGAAYAISIFPVEAKTARGAIEETIKEVDKRFTDVRPREPVDFSIDICVTLLERELNA